MHKALLDNGRLEAKILVNAANNKGRTALHLAYKGCCSKSVSMLIKLGADLEQKDSSGLCALNLAKGNAATVLAFRTQNSNTQASQGRESSITSVGNITIKAKSWKRTALFS